MAKSSCSRCGGSRVASLQVNAAPVAPSKTYEVEGVSTPGMVVDMYGVTWPMFPGNWLLMDESNIAWVIRTYGYSFNFRTVELATDFKTRNGF